MRYSRAFYLIIGFLLGSFTYIFELPMRIVDFKESYPKALAYVYEKTYDSSDWIGIFDTFPEGIVDINELGVSSPVEVALDIAVYDGNKIDGTIWWQGSCDLGLPYQGILIGGDIKLGGSEANVEVYDFIDGQRKSFFKGMLRYDGLIIDFFEFPVETGLNGTRIAKNPSPATLEQWGNLYCGSFLEENKQVQPLQ